ncbi:mycobacterial cell wall arabinan synthesis family protein [Mycobacterium xenopi 4042]|uniref:Mycobacterial cell wall arabinan synthesis family protein n=1 Tax=Mycobacterium xenopi 4042 TaxID=1299334 RepID=X8DJX1_MYCXE|nr:mycobacterial cell wall arabinan synthesis family protein [Mycobacterium xenopi 4042]
MVAEDLSLTPEDWIAVTPPRVPDLRSLQEYVGSSQPVLMDWAVGLAFPCQRPMLHAYGVTEIPKFRITRITQPRSRTPTPGRTAPTAACSASPTCCCGPTSWRHTCRGTGPRLGFAAQVRHHRQCPARAAGFRQCDARRLVVAGTDSHQGVTAIPGPLNAIPVRRFVEASTACANGRSCTGFWACRCAEAPARAGHRSSVCRRAVRRTCRRMHGPVENRCPTTGEAA